MTSLADVVATQASDDVDYDAASVFDTNSGKTTFISLLIEKR